MEIICRTNDLRFKDQPGVIFWLTWFLFEGHHVVLIFFPFCRHCFCQSRRQLHLTRSPGGPRELTVSLFLDDVKRLPQLPQNYSFFIMISVLLRVQWIITCYNLENCYSRRLQDFLTASNHRGIEEEINNEGMKIHEDTTIQWGSNPLY